MARTESKAIMGYLPIETKHHTVILHSSHPRHSLTNGFIRMPVRAEIKPSHEIYYNPQASAREGVFAF